jgi:hypothetical protein
LTIPAGVQNIDGSFMSGCFSFNRPLVLPAGITGIGSGFLYDCHSFDSLVANCNVWPADGNSLATTEVNAAMYFNGITVTGDYAAQWKANLPDRAASPYRKLITG